MPVLTNMLKWIKTPVMIQETLAVKKITTSDQA